MIKTTYIDTISQLEENILFKQPYKNDIGRYRDLCLYRGMPDSSFELLTSLQRNCKLIKNDLEYTILTNFAKYAELEDASITDSIWRKMIIGQHHGLSTRLLDWTRSPLIALHFATTEGNMDQMDQRDCVVWKIDVTKLNEHLPENYKKIIEKYDQGIFNVEMLNEACGSELNEKEQLDSYDTAMGDSKIVILEPPSIDPRIVNQYSFFAVVPSSVSRMEDLLTNCADCCERFVISKNLKWQIRDMLDQANVNERIVYPGLDGIAQWITRHYFARNLNRLRIEKMDIVNADVDAIVNPTNEKLASVGAVCSHIFDKAGRLELEAECAKYSKCNETEAIVTGGYNLKARNVIHTVVPVFSNKDINHSLGLLAKLYENALKKAVDNGCYSIAFPLIGTGANGYPKDEAWEVALTVCKRFQANLVDQSLDIIFCVIGEAEYQRAIAIKSKLDGQPLAGADWNIVTGRDLLI